MRLAVVVVVCAGLAAALNRWGRAGARPRRPRRRRRAPPSSSRWSAWSSPRVLRSWPLTLAFIAVMLTVASVTAGRRLVRDGPWWWAFAPVLARRGAGLGRAWCSAGWSPARPSRWCPSSGILIGGAMTATTHRRPRSLDALRTRRGEYEAALSIGLVDRDAALLVARDDAALALVPGLDQTRTVGLVTLPGAFVGMLLGGASPAAGGRGAAAGAGRAAAGAVGRGAGHPGARRPGGCASEPTGEIPWWCRTPAASVAGRPEEHTMEKISPRLLSWASILEPATREQATATSRCRSSTRTSR